MSLELEKTFSPVVANKRQAAAGFSCMAALKAERWLESLK